MSEQLINTQENPIVRVDGAFEIFEGAREELTTITRHGLLQVGDQLPHIPGIDVSDKPFVIHTVNALGTESCDTCVTELETFRRDHPEIPVFTLTKQTPEEMQDIDVKTMQEGKSLPEHQRLTIDQETAIDLGVALEPGEGADKEFWPKALRRTLAFINADSTIADIQQNEDQEKLPNFDTLYALAELASKK